jgi:hypothetical protein
MVCKGHLSSHNKLATVSPFRGLGHPLLPVPTFGASYACIAGLGGAMFVSIMTYGDAEDTDLSLENSSFDHNSASQSACPLPRPVLLMKCSWST